MIQRMDQWTKLMESMHDSWKAMTTVTSVNIKPAINMQDAWSAWFEAARAGCEMNAAWWRTFMDQSEEMFLKGLQNSPMRSDDLERPMSDLWTGAKKTQHAQQETIKEQLLNMEGEVKQNMPSPTATTRPKARK